MGLRYFFNEEEIESKEYEALLIDDALSCGESKTIALNVVRENRREARETGKNVFNLESGGVLTIRA